MAGRGGSLALVFVVTLSLAESPGNIDFLFDFGADHLPCPLALCGISSILVLRALWCLPRVDLARSRKPIVVCDGCVFVISMERLANDVHPAVLSTLDVRV